MQLGIIGLGRMGSSMTRRAKAGNNEVVAFERLAPTFAALAPRVETAVGMRARTGLITPAVHGLVADRLLSAMRLQFGGHLET